MLEPIQALFNWLNSILAAIPFASAKGIITTFLVLATLGTFMLNRNTEDTMAYFKTSYN